MTYLLLNIGRLENILMISPLSQICLYVASAGHDYKHPGMNNKFLVQTSHEIAIQFNDQAVLESFHAAELSKLFLDLQT